MDYRCIFEQNPIGELITGWRRTGSGYECVYCGRPFQTEQEAAAHAAEERLEINMALMNTELNGLTLQERALAARLGTESGKPQLTSADRAALWNIRRKVLSAKILLALADSMPGEKALRRRGYAKPALDSDTELVVLAGGGGVPPIPVTGYASKYDVHVKGLRHTTTLILAARPVAGGGGVEILTGDRSAARAPQRAGSLTGRVHVNPRLDVYGGHLVKADLSPAEGADITMGAFLRCAVRELKEEMYAPRLPPPSGDSLEFLFFAPYEGRTAQSANHELSAVYLYHVKTQSPLRFFDFFIDSFGERIRQELPCRFRAVSELLAMPEEMFSDGAGRVMRILGEEPDTLSALFARVNARPTA